MRSLLCWAAVLALAAPGALAQPTPERPPDPFAPPPPAAPGLDPAAVSSPDGTLVVSVGLDADGVPHYAVARYGQAVIRPSRLGLSFADGTDFARGLRLVETTRRSADTVWEQPWGEVREVRDRHNELRVGLADAAGRRMDVVFRVFDDGLGFRYEWPDAAFGSFVVADEHTEFALAGDPMAWSIPAYRSQRYEHLYRRTPLSAVADTVHTPLTLQTDAGLFVALHEAALTDYASMTLAPAGTDAAGVTLKADLVPWSNGDKVRATAPFVSPWRTAQVSDTPGGLLTSTLALNLNEPSRIADTSWIEPGKYVGIWWGMHTNRFSWGQGDIHGATTARTKAYMDFAADHGFSGVLAEGWNVGWDGRWWEDGSLFSFTEPYPDFDPQAVAAYGRERGVGLIGHHETGADVGNYEAQLEAAFALYERLGVRVVKTGYVGPRLTAADGTLEWHHGQFGVRHYRLAVETAARHRVAIDAHEPIKDTGIRRTWPNMMTREGARGQEFNAFEPSGGNPPDHTPTLAFTRMLAGPMDYTPGIFGLFAGRTPINRVRSTLAHQLALYVVLYSPLHMAADFPEEYEARPDAFQFIEDVPVDWDETRVLAGAIGAYAVVARKDRAGDDWYLGAITDGTGRTLSAPLSFLDEGPYIAEVYADGTGADWDTDPFAFETRQWVVDRGTSLALRLAPGGGQAVRLRPATPDDLASTAQYR